MRVCGDEGVHITTVGHAKLFSNNILTLLDVMSSSSICEIGTNLVSYPDPSLGTRIIPIYHI